ncbi:anthocyanin 5-aromatic acyltransferase-like [Panicum miliaceum]|uniref:Anthocyanin 5-aromatic acyltransferase-like n=1 Tax=Panicum miliaceum TaxID=4540 RepID=A0A3L6PD53_PANMI|nr:anthocyanin 5-aromatic acyltransferase-like [Panicum miliaceum]
MGSRVRALSVTHVRPAETSNPPPQGADRAMIKLSLFDAMFIALTPIQRLFFYEGDDLPPFPDLVRALRSSLADTLAVFTPLAGQVAVSTSGDGVAIDCSPGAVSRGGVRFVEAEYAGGANDLAPAIEVSALPAPALAVQVTRPAHGAGGGIGAVVVGVTMNHVVADGQALWEFIRAWAAAARGGSTAGTGLVAPTFDRAAINQHPKAEEVARKFLRIFAPGLPTVNTFPEPGNALQGRRTYLLSASQIRSLKHRISLHSKSADGDTAPAVWTSGVRAKNALADADLMFAANCRARLRPPLPAAFFGNCAKSCYARATVGALRDGGAGEALARAAAAVREAVREQLADPLGDADRVVQVGPSNRFAAYETDFGWGRPALVELASVFVREFVAVVGAPDGAVQVSVALDRDRMDGFEANFLSLSQASG